MRAMPVALLVSLALVASSCGGGNERGSEPTAVTTSLAGTSLPSTEPATTAASTTAVEATAVATTGSPATTTTTPVEPIAWQPVATDPTLQEGWVTVPSDTADPVAGTFRLHVMRRLADDPSRRIGSLFVNPGGPGSPGIQLAVNATGFYSPELLARFDIIAWDPRGTGTSTPAIDCIDDYNHYFAGTDITPDTPEERQQLIDLAVEFQTNCATKNAAIIQHVGTNDAARDIDAIRRAIGEDRISYFGWSYGSVLGATWATMFPATVRAAVFDGVPDPTLGFVQADLVQSAGFEQSLDTFLAQCSADTACAFHNDGHADTAFDALMQSLDDGPIPTAEGLPPLTRAMALAGVLIAMYAPSWWTGLAGALANAQRGDGAWLLAFYDRYYQRNEDGTYPNNMEAFQTITCMDATERPTVVEVDATSAQFRDVAPRSRPGTTGDYFCSFFPVPQHPRIAVTGIGAGPILVVGNTGDPATPLVGARAMAGALEEGILLEVVGGNHTAYTVNTCAKAIVDAYLLGLAVPAEGSRCD